MVVVKRLINETHFEFVKSTHKYFDIAQVFMEEIFRLHATRKKIFSDQGTKFTSIFFKKIFVRFGTQCWVCEGRLKGWQKPPVHCTGCNALGIFLDPILGGHSYLWFCACLLHMVLGMMFFFPWYLVDLVKGTTTMF